MSKTKTGGTGRPRTLAIDIGGSGVKMMLLDRRGRPLMDRIREMTPRPATRKAVIPLIVRMAKTVGRYDRVAVGFPGVVKEGVIHTAANLHPSWIGTRLDRRLSALLKRPVRVANDADVQGMASIRGRGTELVVTLGTGVGSALFHDGKLFPNLELGHQPFRNNKSYEQLLGEASLINKGGRRWNRILRKAMAKWENLVNYDRFYLGGGNAKKIKGKLQPNVEVVSNRGGLLGGIHLWE
jgi:polyphosphate glucokinase